MRDSGGLVEDMEMDTLQQKREVEDREGHGQEGSLLWYEHIREKLKAKYKKLEQIYE